MSSQPPLTLAQRRANAMGLYSQQGTGWNAAMGGTPPAAPAPGISPRPGGIGGNPAPPPGLGVLPRLQPPPPAAPPVAATAPPLETGGPLGLPTQQQRPPGLGTPAPGPFNGGVVGPPVSRPPVTAQPGIPLQAPPPAAPPIGAPAVGLRRQQATAAAAGPSRPGTSAGIRASWTSPWHRAPREVPGAPPPGDERLRRRAQELALSRIQ